MVDCLQNKFTMVNLREEILKNQITYYNGVIAKHKQNVDIYLNQPVGIGEHSDIMEAIQAELDKMAIHEDRLAILNSWPQGDDNAESGTAD